jgi:hypothetical protein
MDVNAEAQASAGRALMAHSDEFRLASKERCVMVRYLEGLSYVTKLILACFIVALALPMTVSASPQQTRAQLLQSCSSLSVADAWAVARLESRFMQGMGEAIVPHLPIANHSFIVVQFVLTSDTELKLKASDFVVEDLAGARYLPIGGEPFYFDNIWMFDPKRGAIRAETGSREMTDLLNGNAKVEIFKDQPDDPAGIVMTGNKANLTLVYEVPTEWTGLAVSMCGDKSHPIKVSPKRSD